MFQTKFVEKIKTHVLCSNDIFFPWKSSRLWENVGKYTTARQVTDDNTAHVACWITKATDTH